MRTFKKSIKEKREKSVQFPAALLNIGGWQEKQQEKKKVFTNKYSIMVLKHAAKKMQGNEMRKL